METPQGLNWDVWISQGYNFGGIPEYWNGKRSEMRTRMPGNKSGASRNHDDYMLDHNI